MPSPGVARSSARRVLRGSETTLVGVDGKFVGAVYYSPGAEAELAGVELVGPSARVDTQPEQHLDVLPAYKGGEHSLVLVSHS
eukprot:1184803-Prorocentrum_minimum.AAC.3